jgi:hypothetical protein
VLESAKSKATMITEERCMGHTLDVCSKGNGNRQSTLPFQFVFVHEDNSELPLTSMILLKMVCKVRNNMLILLDDGYPS